MIRLIRGVVVARSKDGLVVDTGGAAGGLGFKVLTPEPTAARFPDGAAVLLHAYLQVREDALTLFGFESEDELQIFEMLLTVSGVGPKMALSILSTLSPDALRLALANQEPALVARTPGVGKRTAHLITGLCVADLFKQPPPHDLKGLLRRDGFPERLHAVEDRLQRLQCRNASRASRLTVGFRQ